MEERRGDGRKWERGEILTEEFLLEIDLFISIDQRTINYSSWFLTRINNNIHLSAEGLPYVAGRLLLLLILALYFPWRNWIQYSGWTYERGGISKGSFKQELPLRRRKKTLYNYFHNIQVMNPKESIIVEIILITGYNECYIWSRSLAGIVLTIRFVFRSVPKDEQTKESLAISVSGRQRIIRFWI